MGQNEYSLQVIQEFNDGLMLLVLDIERDLKRKCTFTNSKCIAPAAVICAVTNAWPCKKLLTACVVTRHTPCVFSMTSKERSHDIRVVPKTLLLLPSLSRSLAAWHAELAVQTLHSGPVQPVRQAQAFVTGSGVSGLLPSTAQVPRSGCPSTIWKK